MSDLDAGDKLAAFHSISAKQRPRGPRT